MMHIGKEIWAMLRHLKNFSIVIYEYILINKSLIKKVSM